MGPRGVGQIRNQINVKLDVGLHGWGGPPPVHPPVIYPRYTVHERDFVFQIKLWGCKDSWNTVLFSLLICSGAVRVSFYPPLTFFPFLFFSVLVSSEYRGLAIFCVLFVSFWTKLHLSIERIS